MAWVFPSPKVTDQRLSRVFDAEIYDKNATEELMEIQASCADAQKQAVLLVHEQTDRHTGYEHYDQRWRKDKQDIQLHRWIEEREE